MAIRQIINVCRRANDLDIAKTLFKEVDHHSLREQIVKDAPELGGEKKVLAEDAPSRVRLHIPQKEGKTLAILEARARIYAREYRDGTVELEAEVPPSLARRVKEWVVR